MIRLLLACLALLLCASCSFVDPLIASGDYEVEAEGGNKIRVKLDGGSELSRLRQRDLIQDLMLDMSKDPDRVAAAFDAMLELEAFFQANGFPIAQVDHEVGKSEGVPQVRYTIQPGPRVTVSKLHLSGNQAFDEETLIAYWTRRKDDNLGLGNDLYIRGDLEALASGIRAHYARAGYLDCNVVLGDPKPDLGPSVQEVEVELSIQEGQRYRLGEVIVAEALQAAIREEAPTPPKPGEPFVAEAVQNYSLELRGYLRARGYHRPEVSPSTTPDPSTRRVKVEINGTPGPRVKVRKIEVEGQDFVSEAAIRSRISLPVEQWFDGRKEEESILRLYQSGFFNRVEVTHVEVEDGVIDVVFKVEETTRYLIQPMIGWGSYEELRGGVEFEMLRFLGSPFDLNTRGVISLKGYRSVATLTDSRFMPWLFGENMTFSISGDAFERKEPSYTDGAIGISPSLSKNFTSRLSARIAYIFREHGDAESDVIDPGAQIGRYTEGSALAEVTWESRDNPLMPKKGSRVSLQYKRYSESLGGDIKLEKIRAFATKIQPLSRTLRLALRAEAAMLLPGDGSDAVPIQERYFNGGENTVRSFREDQLSPAFLKDVNGQAIGGEYMTVGSAELRWAPDIRLFGVAQTELSLFGDAGNLGRPGEDLDTDNLKYAIGAGLRILLPIGPLRFDFAHNPEAEPDERDWTFHFSIGYPF